MAKFNIFCGYEKNWCEIIHMALTTLHTVLIVGFQVNSIFNAKARDISGKRTKKIFKLYFAEYCRWDNCFSFECVEIMIWN